jgi:hypothetical protein
MSSLGVTIVGGLLNDLLYHFRLVWLGFEHAHGCDSSRSACSPLNPASATRDLPGNYIDTKLTSIGLSRVALLQSKSKFFLGVDYHFFSRTLMLPLTKFVLRFQGP